MKAELRQAFSADNYKRNGTTKVLNYGCGCNYDCDVLQKNTEKYYHCGLLRYNIVIYHGCGIDYNSNIAINIDCNL